MQSAGTKTNGSQPPVVRADQITQLSPHQSAILQWVLGQHLLVPGPKKLILSRADLNQPKALNLLHLRGYPLGCGDSRVQPPRLLSRSNSTLKLGKFPAAARFQYAQGHMDSRYSRLLQMV